MLTNMVDTLKKAKAFCGYCGFPLRSNTANLYLNDELNRYYKCSAYRKK